MYMFPKHIEKIFLIFFLTDKFKKKLFINVRIVRGYYIIDKKDCFFLSQNNGLLRIIKLYLFF